MREGWKSSTLGGSCQIKPPKKEARAQLSNNDMVSFVPMNDLGVGEKGLKGAVDRTLASVAGSYTYFADGDVLLAKITPCFENGKLGIARGLTNGVGFGSSEFIVFRPDDSLDSEFLFYFLSQDSFRNAGASVMSGAVGHKRVPKEFIERCPIPLPPIPEQKRIVAILDEAFAGIATAVANTEKNLANARELFESYLNAVISLADESYERGTLGNISDILDSKRKPITKRDRVSGPYPYYGATGVLDYVDGYLFDEPLVLIGEDGAKWGAGENTAYAVDGKCWVNNHAHVIRPNRDLVLDSWIIYYLNAVDLQKFISGLTVPKLNQGRLREIPIPLPPLAEQERIVAIVDDLYAEVRRLGAIYQHKRSVLAELKQSLLHKAFSGELTAAAQDEIETALA